LPFTQTDQLTGNNYYTATAPRGPSFPTLNGEIGADVCVVGGGLSGLSAALELAQRGYSVALLESREVAWAASGRNGGQVIVGFGCDNSTIEKHLGRQDAKRAWDISVEGVRLVYERMKQLNIDCDFTPGWLLLAARKSHVAHLREWHEELREKYGYRAFVDYVPPGEIQQWTASKHYHAAVYDRLSGHIHPLKYAFGLAKACVAAGVKIFEHSHVTSLRHGDRLQVRTAVGNITCRFAVLATNVFIGDLAPKLDERIMPVGGTVFATERLDPQLADSLIRHRAAVCDSNFLLDYYRVTPDNRVLWGGRSTYSKHASGDGVEWLRQKMVSLYPQLKDTKVEYGWGGMIDISLNRAPDFNRLAPNVYYLQGFSGHGLALSGMAGKLAAEAIAGQAERFDVFTRIQHRAFPGGHRLRTPGLVLGTLYYRLRDALG
jgi:gamma-glutamylputrescine oxidase